MSTAILQLDMEDGRLHVHAQTDTPGSIPAQLIQVLIDQLTAYLNEVCDEVKVQVDGTETIQ